MEDEGEREREKGGKEGYEMRGIKERKKTLVEWRAEERQGGR